MNHAEKSPEIVETATFFAHLKAVEDKIGCGDKQFYLSLLWQHESNHTRGLSSSQMFHLERLYNKYSMEELKKQEDFEKNYSENQRLAAIRCARYYEGCKLPYYDIIVQKVLSDLEGHKLTHSEYNKMCNNKYAKKILSCYEEKPKFSVGDFVQIRVSNRVDVANAGNELFQYPRRQSTSSVANKICMIFQVDALPITRAAKGARIYKVLVTDEASTIFVHESDIKKVRGVKN
tara:strand:+ start:706 stop:1404 length:699 start_codon:yes stop_codon:yes gene_type:complete